MIASPLAIALLAAPLFAAPAKAPVPPVRELVEASGAGNVAEIGRLLKAGVPVNGRLAASDNGMTALTAAAALGRADSAKALLAAGADVNLADALGSTPLHKAAFLPIGKDLAAAGKAKREVAAVLLAAKPKLNAKDKQGWTPLMLAAANGDAELVGALLSAGADAAVKLPTGKNARELAEQGGHAAAAALLAPKKKK
ncbi:MAG: ankyrin repeat domain-containing protein [Elusimicrobiota bacterium]|nr:MAG: ankyrin repeat domain-containing protein [Elusimicrobiota bacterium]